MLLCDPLRISQTPPGNIAFSSPRNPCTLSIRHNFTNSMASERATVPAPRQRRTVSALEARTSLVFALATQAASLSQRFLVDLASETVKYVFPKRFESRNLEEAFMQFLTLRP